MKPISIAVMLWLVPWTLGTQWIGQTSGTTARLRGLCVVDERVVWASGAGGTVLRTTDGGTTWEKKPIKGAEALDFRDIEAFDVRTAYALSIGEGNMSRIYKTEDGGVMEAPARQSGRLGVPRCPGILGCRARFGPGRPGGRAVRDSHNRRRWQDLAEDCP